MSAYTAPIARPADSVGSPPGRPLDVPNLYITFSAGRRGAGSVDCRWCGIALRCDVPDGENPPGGDWSAVAWEHDVPPRDRLVIADDLALVERAEQCLADHPVVIAGREIGPTFGPFTYVEATYQWLRVDDGEHLAFWHDARGDWELLAAAGQYEGEAYSDATIAPYNIPDAEYEPGVSEWDVGYMVVGRERHVQLATGHVTVAAADDETARSIAIDAVRNHTPEAADSALSIVFTTSATRI